MKIVKAIHFSRVFYGNFHIVDILKATKSNIVLTKFKEDFLIENNVRYFVERF